MKKSFLLLPLAAAVLTACSSNTSETSPNVEVTEAGSAWQTEVQQVEMPSSMTQPSYPAQQPTYTPVPQPTYGQPQPTYSQPSYGQTNVGGANEMVGNCNVVRDGNNTPIYSQIQKGCYTDSSYTVGKHDTWFLVAYLTGQTANQLAALNNLSTATPLKVGQILRVK